jgi:hypothetical protein
VIVARLFLCWRTDTSPSVDSGSDLISVFVFPLRISTRRSVSPYSVLRLRRASIANRPMNPWMPIATNGSPNNANTREAVAAPSVQKIANANQSMENGTAYASSARNIRPWRGRPDHSSRSCAWSTNCGGGSGSNGSDIWLQTTRGNGPDWLDRTRSPRAGSVRRWATSMRIPNRVSHFSVSAA